MMTGEAAGWALMSAIVLMMNKMIMAESAVDQFSIFCAFQQAKKITTGHVISTVLTSSAQKGERLNPLLYLVFITTL